MSIETEHVLIWSGEHNCYWRPDASGYTSRAKAAGIYTRADAERMTSHCGPEKRIELEPCHAADVVEAARKLLEEFGGCPLDWMEPAARVLEHKVEAWDKRHGA